MTAIPALLTQQIDLAEALERGPHRGLHVIGVGRVRGHEHGGGRFTTTFRGHRYEIADPDELTRVERLISDVGYRATAQAAEMRRALGDQEMHARTGAVASAFHVGPKVLWLREHDPSTFAAADRFMQPRDVVLHALTGVTATDETHANSTLFFDLRARVWADDFLDRFSLHAGLFPDVAPSWCQIGAIDDRAAARTGVPAGCPVVLGAADSQCAAFGSDVQAPGPISEMAGASSCLNSVIYEPSADPRITHYSYLIPDCYCTELGINVSGGALRWAVDRFRLRDFEELQAGARNVRTALRSPNIGDPRAVAPLFLPYLGDGERDDAALRAAFIGLSDRHGRDELAYAVGQDLDLQAQAISGACARSGLTIHSVFTGLVAYSANLMLAPERSDRARGVTYWSDAIRFASKLGARSVGGHVGSLSRPDADDPCRRAALWNELQEHLDQLSREARRHDLDALLVENMACDREPCLMSELELLLRGSDPERAAISLCLDVGHQCVPGTSGDEADPYVWLNRLGRQAGVVHLQQSDAQADHHWPFTAPYNERGRIEPDRVLDALAASGAGEVALVLEVIPAFEADDRRVLDELRDSVEYWRHALDGRDRA